MENMYKFMGFIVAFLISVVALEMFGGSQFSEKYLLLVIFGMLLFNYQEFIRLMKNSYHVVYKKVFADHSSFGEGGDGAVLRW